MPAPFKHYVSLELICFGNVLRCNLRQLLEEYAEARVEASESLMSLKAERADVRPLPLKIMFVWN
jgi:hypothetical protein